MAWSAGAPIRRARARSRRLGIRRRSWRGACAPALARTMGGAVGARTKGIITNRRSMRSMRNIAIVLFGVGLAASRAHAADLTVDDVVGVINQKHLSTLEEV